MMMPRENHNDVLMRMSYVDQVQVSSVNNNKTTRSLALIEL